MPTRPTPPPSPLVAVIIVNWNGREWLAQCLPTLAAQTFRQFETIIVDNGSVDGSAAWLRESWPSVRLIENGENVGFAAANNQGIRATAADFIFTLNNDTLLEADCLAELVAAAADPTTGMVAAQVVQWQNPDLLDAAGIEVDTAGIGWNRGWGERAAAFDQPCAVFGANAAAALYRRAMLDEIGLFDERFFAYYEDVDLAWRAQRAGWLGRYTPHARVRHWHSATGGRNFSHKTYLLARNKWWTIAKNYAPAPLRRHLPHLLFYDLLSLGRQLLQTRSLRPLAARVAGVCRWREFRPQPSQIRSVPLAPARPLRRSWRRSLRTLWRLR